MLVLEMARDLIPAIEFEERYRLPYPGSPNLYIACGRLRFPAAFAERLATRRGFPDFRYLFLLEGGGLFVSPRGERIRLRAGDLVCRHPYRDHQILPDPGKLWREFYLVLPPALAAAFAEAGLFPDGDHHSLGLDDGLRRAMDAVIEAVRRAKGLTPLLGELGRFLEYLKKRTEGAALGEADRYQMERAKAILGERLDENPSMESVAGRLGMDYERFRKCFKEAVGIPPKTYRLRRKLAEAALLLTRRELPVGAIAERLGYPDPFCFSRQFRAHYHCTPSQYRQSSR